MQKGSGKQRDLMNAVDDAKEQPAIAWLMIVLAPFLTNYSLASSQLKATWNMPRRAGSCTGSHGGRRVIAAPTMHHRLGR